MCFIGNFGDVGEGEWEGESIVGDEGGDFVL